MRMMLRWAIPTERGNQVVKDGTHQQMMDSLIAELQPEATYYWAEAGERAGMMVFDMREPSQIARIAEQLFTTADAAVEFVPVMNGDDLKKALG